MNYLAVAARLIFALYYFGVGALGLILGDQAKDIANAATPLERTLSETGFMDPLLCLACLAGGGALFIRRTAPLGIVVLAPLVIIIFFFHLVITHDWLWGSLNLAWLAALAWHFRRGFDSLWHFQAPQQGE
jgi:hypothetical protein